MGGSSWGLWGSWGCTLEQGGWMGSTRAAAIRTTKIKINELKNPSNH